jgi:hypothetical protein
VPITVKSSSAEQFKSYLRASSNVNRKLKRDKKAVWNFQETKKANLIKKKYVKTSQKQSTSGADHDGEQDSDKCQHCCLKSGFPTSFESHEISNLNYK